MTYSINSLCHFFGSRKFATKDESRESDPPELHVSLSPDLKPGQMTLSVRIVDAVTEDR